MNKKPVIRIYTLVTNYQQRFLKGYKMRTLTTRDGQTLVVRRLAPGDTGRLQRFNANLSPTSRGRFLPHSYDDATIARLIVRSQAGDDLIYLLLAGDEVAGYFFLWEMDKPVPLLGIGMLDAYQGQGLGKQMMLLLIEDARAADRDGIDLTTMLDNDRAFALYQSVGFRYIANVDNVDGDGGIVTERRMFLPLKPGVEAQPREFRAPV
ncbi:MAG: GNAT family N-acetyltransferase [Armatimonadota bacterium]